MNGDAVYYCATCQRMIHGTQVANGTHRVTVDASRGYRFATHAVVAVAEDERPIVLRLTEEEAALAKHAIGLMVLQLIANDGAKMTDPQMVILAGIVVRLQVAKEVTQ